MTKKIFSADYLYDLVVKNDLKNILQLKDFLRKTDDSFDKNDFKKINKIIENNLNIFEQVFIL